MICASSPVGDDVLVGGEKEEVGGDKASVANEAGVAVRGTNSDAVVAAGRASSQTSFMALTLESGEVDLAFWWGSREMEVKWRRLGILLVKPSTCRVVIGWLMAFAPSCNTCIDARNSKEELIRRLQRRKKKT